MNLFDAIQNGDLDQVNKILKANPDLANIEDQAKTFKIQTNPNETEIKYPSPLHAAIYYCSKQNKSDKQKYYNIIDSLLQYVKDIDDVSLNQKNGLTPLHLAIISSDIHITKKLLANGADINMCDYDGFTALHHAVKESGDLNLVKFLLSHGANESINTPDNDGKTPAHYAAIHNKEKVMDILLKKYKSNFNILDRKKRSPLYYAILNNAKPELINKLINEGGADINNAEITKLIDKLNIIKFAIDRTRAVIRYSSNLQHTKVKSQTAHRLMQLQLVRAVPATPKEKEFITELKNWNLDLSSDKERSLLKGSEFFVKSYNKFMTIKEINVMLKLLHRNVTTTSSLSKLEIDAMKALEFGIGNCAEVSSYAYLLMLEYPENGLPELGLPKINEKIPLERVGFTDEDDHVFIIVGRDPKTDLKNPLTWNDDTIIADAWTNEVYTKAALFSNKNKAEKDFLLNKFKTLMEHLPNMHSSFNVGEKFNQRVHTDEWQKYNQDQEFWKPRSLLNVKSRPKLEENLPDYRPRYSHLAPSHRKLLNDFENNELKVCSTKFNERNSFYIDLQFNSLASIENLERLRSMREDYLQAEENCINQALSIKAITSKDYLATPKIIENFFKHSKNNEKFEKSWDQIFISLDKYYEVKDAALDKQKKVFDQLAHLRNNPHTYNSFRTNFQNYQKSASILEEAKFKLGGDVKRFTSITLDFYSATKDEENISQITYLIRTIDFTHLKCLSTLSAFQKDFDNFIQTMDKFNQNEFYVKFAELQDDFNFAMKAYNELQELFCQLSGCDQKFFPDANLQSQFVKYENQLAALEHKSAKKTSTVSGKVDLLHKQINERIENKLATLTPNLNWLNKGVSNSTALAKTIKFYKDLSQSITSNKDINVIYHLENALGKYLESEDPSKVEKEFLLDLIDYAKNELTSVINKKFG